MSIRSAKLPETPEPSVIGVDDWSYRRGVKFGTIICDLNNHTTLDLLPDRNSETLSRWLKAHQQLAIISRDRAGEYSKAAQEGAPQAVQVADRWHLLKNLGDSLKRLANRFNGQIRLVAQESVKASPSEVIKQQAQELTDLMPQKDAMPIPSSDRRQDLYKKIHELAAEQVSIREISRRLGIQRLTVRSYLRALECPRPVRRVRSSSVLEFTEYLQKRWQDGCHNAAELYRDVRERGYSGNYHAVRRTVEKWRDSGHPVSVNFSAKPPSASMVARLLLHEVNLTPELKRLTDRLLTINPVFRQARKLGQEFVDMVRNRRVEMWSGWVSDATSQSAPLEIRSFGESLKQDEQAVKQAMSCDLSNGQVEGHVNRLKTIKRLMYGRGSFELLRRRMLLKIPR